MWNQKKKMAFWSRIGQSKLRQLSYQSKVIPYASLINPTAGHSKACVSEIPHLIPHGRPTDFGSKVRYFAAPVQVLIPAWPSDHLGNLNFYPILWGLNVLFVYCILWVIWIIWWYWEIRSKSYLIKLGWLCTLFVDRYWEYVFFFLSFFWVLFSEVSSLGRMLHLVLNFPSMGVEGWGLPLDRSAECLFCFCVLCFEVSSLGGILHLGFMFGGDLWDMRVFMILVMLNDVWF